MSVLLAGDATASYPEADSLSTNSVATYQAAWQFPVLHSGIVQELRFRTNATANTGLTGLRLGAYSDDADAPANLLGYGTFSGQPGVDSWIAVTGLSIPVFAGEKVWLAVLPLGTGLSDQRIHYNTAVASGGSIGTDAPSTGGGTTAPLLSPWPPFDPDNDDALDNGPLGFQALGLSGERSSSKVEIAITTHHDLETETPASVLAWLHWSNVDELTIPPGQEGARVLKVTVGTWTRAAQLFDSGDNDYLYRLFIRVGGKALLWAPAKTAWDAKARTCTITAVDVDRLIAHNVRLGDVALNLDNGFDGLIPVDYRGLRLLRDAANNTTEQNDRFVAPLGIRDGTNTNTESAQRVTVGYGANVHQSMLQLAAGLGAVEFEIEALDVDDPGAYPNYMQLNTFDRQGVDMAQGAVARVFHYRYGLVNLDNFKADPGMFITHAHVLGDGAKPRATRYHALSSRLRGVYVAWRATQLKVAADNLAPLEQIAEAFIKAYGVPLQSYTMNLKPIDLQRWVPGVDFGIGDVIRGGVKVDYFIRERDVRVVRVVLRSAGRLGGLTADIKVVPSLVEDADIDSGEE